MLRTERSIEIQRPPKDVFAFVAEPTNDPRWHTTVLETRRIGDPPTARGSRFAIRHDGGGDGIAEIVAFDPPRAITLVTHFSKPSALFRWLAGDPRLSFVIEPSTSGTRLTRRVDFFPVGPFRLLQGVLQPSQDRRNDELLTSIKHLLESAAEA